jgi:hypothetical protein
VPGWHIRRAPRVYRPMREQPACIRAWQHCSLPVACLESCAGEHMGGLVHEGRTREKDAGAMMKS